MDWFTSFFHPEKAYEKAQEELDKYYQEGQSYLKPYSEYGQRAYGDISSAMKSLLDPTRLQAKWTQSYEESPSAKQAEALAQQHGLDAASGLGLMGSSSALDAIQSGTSNIALNDRQNYLSDLMNKYLAGAGIGQNIYSAGAGAANTMGQNAMSMGQSTAQTAYGQQSAPGSLFGNLLGTGLGLVGSLFGGSMGSGGGGGSGWSPTGSYNSRRA